MLYKLRLEPEAERDLELLWQSDEDAAADISILLEEAMGGNQDLLDTFTCHDFGAYQSESYSIKALHGHQSQGRNIWRGKVWDLEPHGYRIVYAFDALNRRYHVLGIFQRNAINYDDPTNPANARCIASYERLCIRSIR